LFTVLNDDVAFISGEVERKFILNDDLVLQVDSELKGVDFDVLTKNPAEYAAVVRFHNFYFRDQNLDAYYNPLKRNGIQLSYGNRDDEYILTGINKPLTKERALSILKIFEENYDVSKLEVRKTKDAKIQYKTKNETSKKVTC